MLVHHLNDDCGTPEHDLLLVFVSDYTSGSWEGSGYALGLGIDGKVYDYCLGHCSCYGPLERDNGPECVGTYEKYKSSIDIHIVGHTPNGLYAKFIELCEASLSQK